MAFGFFANEFGMVALAKAVKVSIVFDWDWDEFSTRRKGNSNNACSINRFRVPTTLGFEQRDERVLVAMMTKQSYFILTQCSLISNSGSTTV